MSWWGFGVLAGESEMFGMAVHSLPPPHARSERLECIMACHSPCSMNLTSCFPFIVALTSSLSRRSSPIMILETDS